MYIFLYNHHVKILLINKYHHLVGGAERYYFDLASLLTKKGHEVAFFSMEHQKNRGSSWNKYFVSNIYFKDINIKKGINIFSRMLYSREARQKISLLLDVFRPDIVHIHNIYYHISPSILFELKKRNIPVVYTVHDYHLLTPNVTFFHNGSLCHISLKNKLYKSVFHKCVQNSHLASLATSICLYIHDALRVYQNNVDIFISPSRFMKKQLAEITYNADKIVYLPNFIETTSDTGFSELNASYVLFMGDGSDKKGLAVVIEAAKRLPFVRFRVAGRETSEQAYRKTGLKNIKFLGFLSKRKLAEVVSESAFIIVPSLWYENQPYSILESFAHAKPVIASNIGGIPELVKNGKNGFLFEPGNVDACVDRIKLLWRNQALIQKLGKAAKKLAKERFSPESHYKELMKTYRKAQRLHALRF